MNLLEGVALTLFIVWLWGMVFNVAGNIINIFLVLAFILILSRFFRPAH